MELTDRFIRGAKVERRTEYADESWRPDIKKKRRGLLLVVEPGGTKAWYVRKKTNGQRFMRTIGSFPELSLADARELLDDIDDYTGTPQEAVQAILAPSEPAVPQLTVRRLARRYIDEEAEPFNRDWKNQQRTLEVELVERYGDLPADELKVEHVLTIVQDALDRDAPRVAQEALKQVKGLYNWALGKKRVRRRTVAKEAAKTAMVRTAILEMARNPAEGIIAPTYEPRSYHMEGKPLLAILDKLRKSTLRDDVKTILQLQAMTFARVGEVCGAQWSEFNLRKKMWIIPAERYKTGKEHTVTLPTQAVKILKALERPSQFLFPLPRADRPLSSDIIGKDINKHRKALKVHKDFSSHALRHSGATWLAANGCPIEVRERLLGHTIDKASDMAQRYQHHEFFDERREWTQKWCDFLTEEQK
jgi:integrase